MKLEDLTLEHVKKVIEIWKECGGKTPFYFNVERFYNGIKNYENDSFRIGDGSRIGSEWSGHSKLCFRKDFKRNYYFHFNPNISEGEPFYEEAEKAAEKFHKKCDDYLNSISANSAQQQSQ